MKVENIRKSLYTGFNKSELSKAKSKNSKKQNKEKPVSSVKDMTRMFSWATIRIRLMLTPQSGTCLASPIRPTCSLTVFDADI